MPLQLRRFCRRFSPQAIFAPLRFRLFQPPQAFRRRDAATIFAASRGCADLAPQLLIVACRYAAVFAPRAFAKMLPPMRRQRYFIFHALIAKMITFSP